MALKVELKPGEKFILGDSVITNDAQRTRLTIEGDAPILREKDVMLVEEADTSCKRIYLLVQSMYLSSEPSRYHQPYFQLVKEIIGAAPSTIPYFDEINNLILTGQMYKALKATKALVDYEGTLLSHASGSSSIRIDGQNDGRGEPA